MNGLERFDFYLNKVQELLNKAKAEVNPGWWLFINGFRTPMFMLEALAKLYSKLHDKDVFKKLQDRFKQLEDVLGDIDHYHAYNEEFKNKTNVSPETLQHFDANKEKYVQLFNEILVEEKWLGSESGRIEKIRKKLQEVHWLSEEDEIMEIRKFYLKSIESIKEFYASINGVFTDMESQVHELRRKLRWLSIYPQALQGSIQLRDSANTAAFMDKYLVSEIVDSPFNKMPDAAGTRHILFLDKNSFLALSWLIAELGKLKDAGLGIIALQEASTHNRMNNVNQEEKEVQQDGNPTVEDYLSKATGIVTIFFAEGNLDKLVADKSRVG